MTAPLARLLVGVAIAAAAASPATAQSEAPAASDFQPEIRAQLTARQYTTLSSEIAARIDRITTRTGERFGKGDLLVEFDCAIPRAQLARAKAVLVQADKTYAINARLLSLKSVGQLELDVSAAEVQKGKAEVAAAEATVSKCTIAAPFAGITTEQKAREYQYATPGQPLLEILDDHGLEIELIAPSRWLGWLKPKTAFDLAVDETGRVYHAEVNRLAGRVDPVSQSIKVIGDIIGPADGLIAGMSGRVLIAPPPRK